MTYDDLEQQMHLRFQSTLPRGEQLNMSKLPPPRTVPQQVSSCLQIDLRECFGTAPLPTSTSVASPRGEGGSSDRSSARQPYPQAPQSHPRVAKGVFWPVFGTAPLPTGTPVASPRDEGGLLTGLRHEDHAHRYLRGILAWRGGSSISTLARVSLPQVLLGQGRVAKRASIGTLAR